MFAEFLKESFDAVISKPHVLIKAGAPGVGALVLAAIVAGGGYALFGKLPSISFGLGILEILAVIVGILLLGAGSLAAAATYAGVERRPVMDAALSFLPRYVVATVLAILPFILAMVALIILGLLLDRGSYDIGTMLGGFLLSICLLGIVFIVYSLGMASFIYRAYLYKKGIIGLFVEQLGLLLNKTNLKFGLVMLGVSIIVNIAISLINMGIQAIMVVITSIVGGPYLVLIASVVGVVAMSIVGLFAGVLINTFGFKYAKAYKL